MVDRPTRATSIALSIALVLSGLFAMTVLATAPGRDSGEIEAPPSDILEGPEEEAVEAPKTSRGPLVGLTREGVRAWAEKIGVPEAKLAVIPDAMEPLFEIDEAGGGIITPRDANEVGLHNSDMAHALGFDGTGVTVAVIDTGLDFAHPDLFNTTFRVNDTGSPYHLHPVTYDGASLNDYLVMGEPGPNSWWVNTSFSTPVVESGMTRSVNWTDGTTNLSWDVTGVSGLMAGEEVRVGFHPDDKLNAVLGFRPGVILFNDTGGGGPFDSVLTDLDGDYDLSDEKRAWINTAWATFNATAELMFQDVDGDGIQDISGGMVTFISDGVREIPYASRQIDTLNFTFQTLLNNNSFDIWEGLDPASNLTPGDGNLTILFGDFEGPGTFGSHGTWVTSAIAGQGLTGGFGGGPTLLGHAPGAKIIGAGNNFGNADPFGQMGLWTALRFAAEGYDGLIGTGDEAQIASNSWGSDDWTGWEWGSRYVDYLSAVLADEEILYVFAAGNSGPGMGGRQGPAGGPSLLVAGAMDNYLYRVDPWVDPAGGPLDGGPNPTFGDTAFFSNRGPSALGRHYLDAIASGQFGYGADPLNNNPFDDDSGTAQDGNSSWVLWAGTSLATPNLAGVTTLVYDAYASAHAGAFPQASVAKAIVKQSADDAGQDPTLTGAGIANSLRGVLIADETDGLSLDVDEWNPGDYHGVDYPGYANLLPAGGGDNTTVTLTNHRSSTLTADITDAVLAQAGSLAFTFARLSGTAPDEYLLNASGIMTAGGTVLVPDGAGNWSTADALRISVFFDRQRMIDEAPSYLFRIFDWTDVDASGTFAGFDERNLMTQDFVSFGVANGPNAYVFVHDPVARSHDGLLLHILPLLDPFSPVEFTIVVDYFERMDWPWLSASPGMASLTGGSTATVNLSVSVPVDTQPGLYEAMVLFTLDNGDVTTLPVMVNVAATGSPMTFGGPSTDDIGHYRQGGTHGQFWLGNDGSGDWRYHFLDLPAPANVTVLLEWDDPLSVHRLHVLTNVTDWFSENASARYGLGTEETVASTDIRMVSGNSTSVTAELNEGLSIIVVQSVYVAGIGAAESPRGQAGVFSVTPTSLSGIGVPVEGTDTFTLTSDLGFADVQGVVETGTETVDTDLPVDPYPFSGGDFLQYLFNAPNRFVTTIGSGVLEARYDMFFHSGARDVDFGIFYDNDCNFVYTVGDDAVGTAAATNANPERARLDKPAPGCYVVHAAGFDVEPDSLYNLTLTLVETPVVAFASLPGSVDPGVPLNVTLDWTLPHFSRTFAGNAFLGSAQFPRALPVPVSLFPDLPPMLSGVTPADGAVLASNTPVIGLNWQDTPDDFKSAVDPDSLTLILDGADFSGVALATATGVTLGLPFPLAEGPHTVFLEVHDAKGSQNRTTWSFTIDSTVPELTITEPVMSITNNPTVSIAGRTEPGAIVTVDGTPASVGLLGTFRANLTLADGTHSIPVVATDAAGNTARTDVEIVVDTVDPAIILSSPSEGETVTVASVTVVGQTEPGASVRVNSIAVEPVADGSFRLNIALAAGNNTITAVATDLAGNSGSTSVTVTFDDPAPGLQQDLENANSLLALLRTQIFILVGLLAAALGFIGFLSFRFWKRRR